MSKRKASETGDGGQPEKNAITIENLPVELAEELKQAVAMYRQQLDLQTRPPNHVYLRMALKATTKEFERHIKRLQEVSRKASQHFFIGDDGGLVLRDDGLHECDYDITMDIAPYELFDILISSAQGNLEKVGRQLSSLPIRKKSNRARPAEKLYYTKVIDIFIRAGGTARIIVNYSKQPDHNSFFNFILSAIQLAGITPPSEPRLAVIVKSLI